MTEKRYHKYHAHATALSGFLKLPLEREIEPRGHVELSERGGFKAHHEGEFHADHAVTFRRAYTHVGGNRDTKKDHGWSTLATSVIEGLNIFEIVTADRVVAQINTDHPLEGYVPMVNFLGTRFENLRIAGHPVKIDLNLKHVGEKPASDAAYTTDENFLKRISSQYTEVAKHTGITDEGMRRYNRLPTSDDCRGGVECSLVNSVKPESANPEKDGFPGTCFGHVIHVPNFGVIYLATLKIEQSEYDPKTGAPHSTKFVLKMVEARMGCLADGGLDGGGVVAHGTTHP